MTPFLVIAFSAHAATVTPAWTERACLAAVRRDAQRGVVAVCERRLKAPVVDLDSDGVRP